MNALPYDLNTRWLTYPLAAELAGPGVTVAVIRNWVSRGYRAADGEWVKLAKLSDDEGRPTVLAIEVLRAEAATRRRARRVLKRVSA